MDRLKPIIIGTETLYLVKNQSNNTIIIGASAAGLACAACLQKRGIDYIILEKQPNVGHSWRNHYDRLHLHTSKSFSNLPFVPFDQSLPKYPARADVVQYLETYVEKLNIQPVFNTEVQSVKRDNGTWTIQTNTETYQAQNVIIATGATHTPKVANYPGMDTFPGEIIHSSQYKNGARFNGKRVLVVGFGYSGGEQAIDLHEYGAWPALSVRSAVNVLPRDIMGISILQLGLLMNNFPPQVGDTLNAPLINLLVGDINKLGLKKAKDGPMTQIRNTGRIPLLDIGTIRLIREGHIQVFDGIERIDGSSVWFKNGQSAEFDAIILATGYEHKLERILDLDAETTADLHKPIGKRTTLGKNGLYFCGFYISPTGMLREMGIEAKRIAELIAG